METIQFLRPSIQPSSYSVYSLTRKLFLPFFRSSFLVSHQIIHAHWASVRSPLSMCVCVCVCVLVAQITFWFFFSQQKVAECKWFYGRKFRWWRRSKIRAQSSGNKNETFAWKITTRPKIARRKAFMWKFAVYFHNRIRLMDDFFRFLFAWILVAFMIVYNHENRFLFCGNDRFFNSWIKAKIASTDKKDWGLKVPYFRHLFNRKISFHAKSPFLNIENTDHIRVFFVCSIYRPITKPNRSTPNGSVQTTTTKQNPKRW